MLGARETARSTASVNGRSKKIAPTKSVDEANFHRVNVALQLLPEALNITKPNADLQLTKCCRLHKVWPR